MNILDLLFPKQCVGCHKTGSYLCSSCIKTITQNELICPNCERPAIGGVTHPLCRKRFGLAGVWSLGRYQDPLRSIIHQLKYRWVEGAATTLVEIIVDYWARYQPFLLEQIIQERGEDWVITAVPLHWQRQNWRGFNQSELLAKLLAAKVGLTYQPLLVRTRFTKPQALLSGHERNRNIKNAFALAKTVEIRDKSIILVDDVWTTGSTIKECCYMLKRAGAKQVWALTIAN